MNHAPSTYSASLPRRRAIERWYVRVPTKLAVFGLVTFIVLFPYPRQLSRHLSHLRDMQAMVEPQAPQLESLHHALEEKLRQAAATQPTTSPSASALLRQVERFVLDQVKYEWDWNLWGSADYLPTVSEIFEKAAESGGVLREDCDGRAVIAASLMKRMGYDAQLVTDLRHVWVKTPEGEWMGPGGDKSIIATKDGNEIAWGTLLANVPISISYGIGVFPFWREVVILVAAYVLSLHRRTPGRVALVGLILLSQGLLFMRLGFFAPLAVTREVSSWPSWVGLIHIAVGFGILWRAAGLARRRSAIS